MSYVFKSNIFFNEMNYLTFPKSSQYFCYFIICERKKPIIILFFYFFLFFVAILHLLVTWVTYKNSHFNCPFHLQLSNCHDYKIKILRIDAIKSCTHMTLPYFLDYLLSISYDIEYGEVYSWSRLSVTWYRLVIFSGILYQ